MAAIFDLSLNHTSGSIRDSLVVLSDLENMGMAVEISLLSCIEVEICVISYLLLVNGRHLAFNSHPDVGEYPHKSHRAAGPRKCGGSPWNFVAILYTS
jgi:hypothetical protein